MARSAFKVFNLRVQYIPGKDKVAAEFMSRWAYPASTACADATLHGNARGEEEMKAIIEEERRMERSNEPSLSLEYGGRINRMHPVQSP